MIYKLINDFKEREEQGIPISPSEWLIAASKVNASMLQVDESLVLAKMEVNKLLAEHVRNGESAAKAKILVQATPQYQCVLREEALYRRGEEFIRLAKKRTNLQHFDV